MSLFNWPYVEDRRWPEEFLRALAPFTSAAAPQRGAGVSPPVNLYDNGTAFLLRTEVPGIERESIELTVKGDQLTLSGERKLPAAVAKAAYHRRERSGGQFRRVVTLPQPVDSEKITATYKNGVLEAVLPRMPDSQPRKISVQ